MFNTPTLAENAAGSLAIAVPGTLSLCFPLRLGCLAAQPPPSPHRHWDCSWKVVSDLRLFLSQTFLLGESSRSLPVGAETSWRGFCSWCYRSEMRQPRSLLGSGAGAGGWGAGAAALPARMPTEAPAHCLPRWQLCFYKRYAALRAGDTPTNQPSESPVWPVLPSFFLHLSEA